MADDSDPAAVADATAAFCEDYDDGEETLETVLAVDAERETWTFDDLPTDSGTFGELVSRGIVTKVDGEYRIPSREGVRAGLEGETVSSGTDTDSRRGLSTSISFDRRSAGAFAGAFVFLFLMRILNYRSVFRGDDVVLRGNDPYSYRYWLEELLAESNGITDWSIVVNLPPGVAQRRPVTHVTNWFFAELLGGDQLAADTVAAWLPVVATLALGVVVYRLAVVVTDDFRVGIASVILLALTPVHAVYTGVGFLEHRLHQYFWLGVTLLTLAWLAVDLQRRRDRASTARAAAHDHLQRRWTWLAAVAMGVSLTFSTFAWGGSILMFVPLAAYVGLKVAIDIRAGFPPVLTNMPILVGLGGSAMLAAFLHFRWGWHETFAGVVPSLVVVGAAAVIGFGELWRRLEWSVPGLIGLEVGVAGVGLVALRYLRPDDWARLRDRSHDLFFREHHGATELGSLFSTDNAVILEPMAQLGASFYVAIVVLGWACWIAYRRYEPGWLLLAVYAVFWLVLAAFQVRFAAQLAIPLSVLGGLGFVYILAWIDLARVPRPFREHDASGRGESVSGAAADGGEPEPSIVVPEDRKKLVALAWAGLLICGTSLIFVPTLSAQTTYDPAQYEAAMAIDDHAEAVDREYPENFVLSTWGDNRMYNYFVNGESRSYGYATSNFEPFVTSDDPDGWYETFEQDDVGYVVLTDQGEDVPPQTAQAKLHEELGTGGENGEPLEHYQAVYVDEEVTAFAVVPGANLTVSGDPGETVPVETTVTVSGETIEYERDATVGDDGSVVVAVPYPGEYTVGDREVEVSEAAVENGETVRVE